MLKNYVLFPFFLAFYIVELQIINSTEVMWDNSIDVIYYEGKLYYPDQNTNKTIEDIKNEKYKTKKQKENSDKQSNEIPNSEKKNNEEENKTHFENEEEDLASGGKFWFCIIMIFSK